MAAINSSSQVQDNTGARSEIQASDDFVLVQNEIKKLEAECTELSFLAVGKTGVGKSTLLNAMTETDTFKSSADRSATGTKIITKYLYVKNGVTITAWDSPGFQDSSGNEELYKQELKKNCSNVDVMIYCISLKETRCDIGEDGSAFKQITDALTVNIWRRSIVVLTCANKLESRLALDKRGKLEDLFSEQVQIWRDMVQTALKDAGVEESIYKNIKVVPAGHIKRKHLPGQKYWLSTWWTNLTGTM